MEIEKTMRCDEIEQALNGEMANFKAAVRHIKKCPYCSKIYKDEMELENSLRDLSQSNESVDIVPDLYPRLDFKQDKYQTSSIIKRWAWLTSIVFFAGILITNIGTIADTINRVLVFMMSWKSGYTVPNDISLNQIAESLKANDYYYLVLYITSASAVAVFYYLWREFKEIVK